MRKSAGNWPLASQQQAGKQSPMFGQSTTRNTYNDQNGSIVNASSATKSINGMQGGSQFFSVAYDQ